MGTIRFTDIVVQSLNRLQILKDSILVMLLINTLNDVDFEVGSRSVFKTLVQSPYGDNGVAYRWNNMRLLEHQSSPEARVEEA